VVFLVDPNQDPDFVKNPFTNKANPIAQNKLIKDLLKYTPDQLDNKEAELVNMIDNAINKNKNVKKINLIYFILTKNFTFYKGRPSP
jgi:hypothetical protein